MKPLREHVLEKVDLNYLLKSFTVRDLSVSFCFPQHEIKRLAFNQVEKKRLKDKQKEDEENLDLSLGAWEHSKERQNALQLKKIRNHEKNL